MATTRLYQRRVARTSSGLRVRFGLWLIAAFHPVNALLLTYAAFTLAKRSSSCWTAGAPDPQRATTPGTAVPSAA